MSNEALNIIIAIAGLGFTIVCTAVASGFWFAWQFRRLEKVFYREMDKHRDEDDTMFKAHDLKIQRLELKTFGFTPVDVARP